MTTPTTEPRKRPFTTLFHRDHTVSIWDCHNQIWRRMSADAWADEKGL